MIAIATLTGLRFGRSPFQELASWSETVGAVDVGSWLDTSATGAIAAASDQLGAAAVIVGLACCLSLGLGEEQHALESRAAPSLWLSSALLIETGQSAVATITIPVGALLGAAIWRRLFTDRDWTGLAGLLSVVIAAVTAPLSAIAWLIDRPRHRA
ncbi:MAG: hypothetical protein IE923_07990 [Micrococcales bacterium]|nr:hypothetical protein [Micrococcales bacterium]